MLELIAFTILIGSLLGMEVIIFRKLPLLAELPEVSEGFTLKGLLFKLKEKVSQPFRSFSLEIFLQKILSKIRILTLKTENKTSIWLQKLREKSLKNKQKEKDNYWKEIKKSTKNNLLE